jgi:AAHS family 4-hydroxybenzoate transporter-like MFS transporter
MAAIHGGTVPLSDLLVPIDVRKEIESASLTPFHILVALLIALIVFFDGYDSFNAAYVIHYVVIPWHLQSGQAGFLVSSSLIGFMVGSMLQGKLSDRYGRRRTLLLALWNNCAFSLATALFAHSFWTFCTLRFCAGLGIGTLLPLGITYMNEFAPARLLNTFSIWGWTLGFAMGGVVASIVGIFLTPHYGWQALYFAGSASFLIAISCQVALPESIKFLAMQGRQAEVARLLSRLNPAKQSIYTSKDSCFFFPEANNRAASVGMLLSEGKRRNTLLIWGCALCILFAIYGLNGWIPSAMIERGESFAASFTFGALIPGMGFLGALACGFLADRWKAARKLMCCWWLGGALALITLALVNSHIVNLLCVSAAGFCILGGQGVLNNYTAASAETEVRATSVGMMLGVGRTGAILGPVVLGLVRQMSPGGHAFFFVVAAAAVLAVVMASLIREPGKSQVTVPGTTKEGVPCKSL